MTSTGIFLDPQSPTPPYAQIRDLITELVRSGDMEPGTRLPTVRSLASDLDLAVNTVARAYRELESAGVVVTRGRHGTVVADTAPRVLRDSQTSLRQAAESYLQTAIGLGAAAEEAVDAVRRAAELRTAGS